MLLTSSSGSTQILPFSPFLLAFYQRNVDYENMSRRPEHDNLEEAEEAFIDLEDPNLEVVDEPGNEEGSCSDDDDTEEGNEEVGNDEVEDEDALQQDAEVEDLNAVPDQEPERDDASATFMAPGAKPIHAVTTSLRDTTLFAAAGEGEEVYILRYDAQASSYQVLQTLRGHSDTVSLLAFSPNGEWLASGGLDSTVCLWSTATWERVHSLTDLCGEIMTLLWHPSSLVLVAGADDAQAAMWNVAKGSLAMYFVGHRGPVTTAIWSPDVKKLITGSSDGSVSVYNPKTGEQEVNIAKDLSPDNAGVTCLCFATNDQCIVGCEDGTAHVFSLRTGKVAAHLDDLHEQAIESMQVNQTSTLLLTSSCDCRVIVWNLTDFSVRVVLNVGESVIPAQWVHGVLVIAGCSNGDTRLWDGRLSVQEPLRVLKGHRRMVLSIAHAGDVVATGSDDGAVKFFCVAPQS